jgi:hypothetical protein
MLCPPTGAAALKPAPGLAEALRCFAEAHFLGDQDLREEMEAGRGAAHYDMDQYWVREGVGGHFVVGG